MKALVLTLVLVVTYGIPTSFDRRLQPEIVKYSRFELQTEGICAGYTWAKELAQIIGNTVGLFEELKMSLSAQQILECTESDEDICFQADLEDIHAAIAKVQKNGITTSDCYPNRPFAFPSPLCKRQCSDGSRILFNYFPNITKLNSFEDVINLFKSGDQLAVFVIMKVDQSFNYYSPFGNTLKVGGPTSVFEYRVAELVGWKDGQASPKLILRAGPGLQWGYDGYMNLELSKYGSYIEQYYKVELSDQSNLSIQQQ